MTPVQSFILSTVFQVSNIEMNILKESSLDNYNEVRGRFLSANTNISRDSSISSTKSSVAYHEKIEYNNTMNIDMDMDNFSSEVSYETSQEKAL